MAFTDRYGSWAVVAGASEGVGSAFALEVARQGVNVVTWRRSGIQYYAVSDVEADQLARFAILAEQR